jgi:hypothetical protein
MQPSAAMLCFLPPFQPFCMRCSNEKKAVLGFLPPRNLQIFRKSGHGLTGDEAPWQERETETLKELLAARNRTRSAD